MTGMPFPDLRSPLQEGLSGTYVIERELGRGGMGGRDLRLRPAVEEARKRLAWVAGMAPPGPDPYLESPCLPFSAPPPLPPVPR